MSGSNKRDDMGLLIGRIEKLEDRWKKIGIYAGAIGICLVILFGITYSQIPKFVKKEFETEAAKHARDTAQKAAKEAENFAIEAKKNFESIDQLLNIQLEIKKLHQKVGSLGYEIDTLKTEMRAEINEIKTKFDAELTKVWNDSKKEIDFVKGELSTTKEDLSDLKTRLRFRTVKFGTESIGKRDREEYRAHWVKEAVTTKNIKFDKPFNTKPCVIFTPRGGVICDDTFSVTTREVRNDGFEINIFRVDDNQHWGQSLKIDWVAFTTESIK